jgi:2-hydroxychromene-2-carboxylate isomerase
MPPITWYFDVISPFAWLQWPAAQRLAAERPVQLRPILFAGLLERHGHKGPAEIPGKRRFTYRHALWRARQKGLPLRFPPSHPFNPIPALRLCVAAGSTVGAVDAVLRWVWEHGRAADSSAALAPLAAQLGIADAGAALGEPAVKQGLRDNFEAALADGVFGVPTLVIAGELFWGEDATDFALATLHDPELLQDGEFQRLDALPVGLSRLA